MNKTITPNKKSRSTLFRYEMFCIRAIFIACFQKPISFVHLSIILGTILCAWSGLDWSYAMYIAHHPALGIIGTLAFIIGFIVPFVLPASIFLLAHIRQQKHLFRIASTIAYAEFFAWTFSSLYKMFSGRIPPAQFAGHLSVHAPDTSRIFHIGIFKEGIFYGWPSTHTAVACALATCCILLFPQRKFLAIFSCVYAFFIGFGVSTQVHWLSDVLAGACLGIALGWTTVKTLKKKDT